MAAKNWVPVAAGVGVGVVALLLWQKYASASQSALPANSQVTLQPGQQSATAQRSTTVSLALPTGASWTTAGLAIQGITAVAQPTGTQIFNIVVSATPGAMTPVTASWTDVAGKAQTSTVNITIT